MTRLRLRYLAEIGAYAVGMRLIEAGIRALGPAWRTPLLFPIPVATILLVRWWSGEPWRLRDMGVRLPERKSLVQGAWLLSFYAAYFLGVLLLAARFRYYPLLDFLNRVNRTLTGEISSYERFMAAAFTHTLTRLSWQSELFVKGYVQGYAAQRFSGRTGVAAGWLIAGFYLGVDSREWGYASPANLLLWTVLWWIPGPLLECYYSLQRSVLPLVAVRALSIFVPLATTGLFAYWYPDRSYQVGLPVFRVILVVLFVLTLAGWKAMQPLWSSTWRIPGREELQGTALAGGVILIMLADMAVESQWFSGATLVVLAAYLRVSRTPSAS